MEIFATVLRVTLGILVVIAAFNLIIFVHELGHFLAAKWRGLAIDRFQIWFGKPIWKKTIGGVQYGMGWIPAGGFVALPQMAPMESIEGTNNERGAALPPIKPIDKIIVAFAGPLFSFLLALLVATVVWQVGKPADVIPSSTVGYVEPGSPAENAGLRPGDQILTINGQPVSGFVGSLDSIQENIMLSEGDAITFEIDRPGSGRTTVTSGFEVEPSSWFQRRALRQIGIGPEQPAVVSRIVPNSPAEDAGLQPGDRIIEMEGREILNPMAVTSIIRQNEGRPVNLVVERGGERVALTAVPEIPEVPVGRGPSLGFEWDIEQGFDTSIVYPGPWQQVRDSLRMMAVTLEKLVARNSSVGLDHLSGPVGIAQKKYELLQMEDGWRRVLWFLVLFNVNLAVLNMMPLPVLDGGHITIAIMEGIARRPVKARFLEVIQLAFAMLLIGVMLYVTSKDIGDNFGRGGAEVPEMRFR